MDRSLLTQLIRLGAAASTFVGLIGVLEAIFSSIALSSMVSNNPFVRAAAGGGNPYEGLTGHAIALQLAPIAMGSILSGASDTIARWIQKGTGSDT